MYLADNLVEQAQSGDKEAFTQLVAERVDALYATAERILRDSSMAEDATQQTLLSAWRNLPQLQDPGRLDAWLYRLLINACTGQLRQRRVWDRKLRLLETHDWAVPDSTLQLAQRDELERAFAHLSAEHRAVVVLRFYLSWSPDEIASSLDLPAGTVSSRLHYALKALRAALAADERRNEQRARGTSA